MNSEVDIKRVQKRLLEMAVSIRNVLESHNIPYEIAFGTLLGSVRHGGFIPWDDDFDFFLFDESYEAVIGLLREELPKDMFLEDKESEPCYFHSWAHVKDLGSEAICELYPQDSCYTHHGINVDLYRIREIKEKDFAEFRYNEAVAYVNRRKELGFITESDYDFRILSYANRRLAELSESDRVVLAYPFDVGKQYIEDVFPLKKYEFESFEFYGPQNACSILEMRYGNWRELPREDQRKPHYKSVKFFNYVQQ